MQGYGLKVYQCELEEVLRQAEGSGILYNATVIRRMVTHDEVTQLPLIRFKGFADIRMVPGDELIEQLNSSYSEVGMDETIVVTRSNKRANIYNAGIRNMVLGREDEAYLRRHAHGRKEQLLLVGEGKESEERRVKSEASNSNNQHFVPQGKLILRSSLLPLHLTARSSPTVTGRASSACAT